MLIKERSQLKLFKLIVMLITVLACILSAAFSPYLDKFVGTLLILICALMVFQVRKNRLLLILFLILAYVNVDVVFGYYFFPENRLDFITTTFNQVTMTGSLCCLTIFNAVLYFVIRPPKAFEFEGLKADLLFYIFYGIILLCILSVAVLSEDVFAKLNEYLLVIFLLVCVFAEKSRTKRVLTLLLFAVYTLASFIVASNNTITTGRITILQAGVLVMCCLYINRLKLWHFLALALIGIFSMNILGSLRRGNVPTLNGFIDQFISSFLFNETYIFAYGASTTYFEYANVYATVLFRFESLLSFIISIFIGSGNQLTELANLGNLTLEYYMHYFGGIMPFYFYFWGGWTGVVAGAVLVGCIINKSSSSKSFFGKILSLLLVATSFRWYIYNPLNLFRMTILIMFIAYYVTSYILYPMIMNRPLLKREKLI